jgi:putative salt-induced outer membrane protein YdiY
MHKPLTTIIMAAGVSVAMADSTDMSPTLKYPWEHTVSAGVSLTRGNSQTSLFNADFLAVKKTPVNEYMFGIGGAYGDNNSKDTVNNYKAFGQWNHLFNERLYGYLRGEGVRDVISDLNYRFTVGPGVGYYFIKEKMTTLAGEAGIAFTARELGHKSDTYATLRIAERFEHKFSDHARVWQSAEFLPQIDQFDNFVFNFELGAEAALNKSLNLQAKFVDSYQNRPALGRLKNDAQIIAGVNYKF